MWLAVMFACTDASGTDPDTDTPVPVIWPTPTITLLAPTPGLTVGPEGFDTTVSFTDFTLRAKEQAAWSFPLTPLSWLTSAHAHDPTEQPIGYIEFSVDATIVAETIESTIRIDTSSLPAGTHTLWAELLFYDGDFFYPPVIASVAFEVTGDAAAPPE